MASVGYKNNIKYTFNIFHYNVIVPFISELVDNYVTTLIFMGRNLYEFHIF